MTPETLFEQTLISLPQGYSMLNTKCILAGGSWQEDFWRFIKLFLILPLIGAQKGPAPLFEQSESPSSKHISCQVWLKLA